MQPAPWMAERALGVEEASALIESQFPQLAPARVEPLGEGWDNTVFSVNGAWVFRFPRRQVAVPLLEAELRVLPALPALPLPVPLPELRGTASERFPWPFAGYRLLPGITADRAALTDAQRCAAARPLGKFLRALHAVPSSLGGPDSFARLDAGRIRAQTGQRLRELGIPIPGFFDQPVRAPRNGTLVHGDLHARQILVDAAGAVCGLIDWGDVHDGDPACDLAIAHTLLPPHARDEFRAAYGEIDAETWALSRLRGLHLGAALAVYARSASDQRLLREALRAIEFSRTA